MSAVVIKDRGGRMTSERVGKKYVEHDEQKVGIRREGKAGGEGGRREREGESLQ